MMSRSLYMISKSESLSYSLLTPYYMSETIFACLFSFKPHHNLIGKRKMQNNSIILLFLT